LFADLGRGVGGVEEDAVPAPNAQARTPVGDDVLLDERIELVVLSAGHWLQRLVGGQVSGDRSGNVLPHFSYGVGYFAVSDGFTEEPAEPESREGEQKYAHDSKDGGELADECIAGHPPPEPLNSGYGC
jgi:hypothetical protein